MTREEAINEIKSWAIPSEKGREVLETLIPELAESEDESLKNKSGYYKAGKFWKASTLWNATKNKIPQRVSNRYILQECTWNIGNLQDFANEVKNVQEVSLDYPIILDMNGNIIDGAHRVVKAYLEGKDIDIVYLGDDEWPEPDYDEEKAVKESENERIINQLITLVNSAGEVLLIPTNKEELVAWLNKCKESLHIQETCKETANSFTDGIIEVRSFQRGMEEGRRLEKQKEQKHNYCLYGGYPSVGRCLWCYAACSARLADVHTDEEKEYVRTIKSIISDFIRDKKPENLAYYQKIYDWLDGRYVPFSCGHENGKPAEWVLPEDFEEAVYKVANFISPFDNQEELRKTSHRFAEQLLSLAKKELDKTADPVFSKQEYESHPIISTDTTSAKPAELDGKALLHTADKSYQIGFRDGVASVKPAECSKVTINGEPIPTETKSVDIPLAEWSEEDEHRRDGIIQWLREYQAKFNPKYDSLSIESIESLIAWLKSIRPSWKPSEQEKGALRTAIYVLTEERNFPKAVAQLQNILDAFEGKESRKDWKPSEEQMEAFKGYIEDFQARAEAAVGGWNNFDVMIRLYENLKKL